MKERPILMSAPMVRASLAGTKTQTRRVMQRQKKHDFTDYTLFGQQGHSDGDWVAIEHAPDWPDGKEDQCRCPYASRRGDRLWVRETHRKVFGQTAGWIETDYRATYTHGDRLGDLVGKPAKWTPAIHMPRAASRITLEVTDVRVERLQEISEADAWAEGIQQLADGAQRSAVMALAGVMASNPKLSRRGFLASVAAAGLMSSQNVTARAAYAHLWESINGQGSWDANPWVWVIEFKRLKP